MQPPSHYSFSHYYCKNNINFIRNYRSLGGAFNEKKPRGQGSYQFLSVFPPKKVAGKKQQEKWSRQHSLKISLFLQLHQIHRIIR